MEAKKNSNNTAGRNDFGLFFFFEIRQIVAKWENGQLHIYKNNFACSLLCSKSLYAKHSTCSCSIMGHRYVRQINGFLMEKMAGKSLGGEEEMMGD